MAKFKINGAEKDVAATGDTPLLWALRDTLGMTGTKFGCGIGQCGACTVHLDGGAVRSCITAVKDCEGLEVRTIESLGSAEKLHPVQQAWLEESVSQCGYCQPGQIMAAVALLQEKKNPTDREIDEAMSANLCRCGTYPRIRKAVKRAAQIMANGG